MSALLVSLSGCKNEESIIVYLVEGQELDCISMHRKLSCNWPKYNELKKENKMIEGNLKQSAQITRNGSQE